MNREEQHQGVYEFLCEREKNPPPFNHTDMSERYSDNPLTYIAGDGGGLQSDQVNVCIDSDSTLKYRFREVKFPELDNCGVFWYRKGHNDDEEWYLIGRYDYPNQYFPKRSEHCYFFMTAWCDSTGFCCQGDIKFYLSHTLKGLSQYGITDAARQLILKKDEGHSST